MDIVKLLEAIIAIIKLLIELGIIKSEDAGKVAKAAIDTIVKST